MKFGLFEIFILSVFLLGVSTATSLILYIIGKILYLFGLKKIGHKIWAISLQDATIDFYETKRLEKKCPYNHNCEKCRVWTCRKKVIEYEQKEENKKNLKKDR